MRSLRLISILALLASLPLSAQTTLTPSQQHEVSKFMGKLITSVVNPFFDLILEPTISGEPYTAYRFKSEQKHLQDGTTISEHGRRHFIARDSEGRTRAEHNPIDGSSVKFVYIKDPIAGTLTYWVEDGKNTKGDKDAIQIKFTDLYKNSKKPPTNPPPPAPPKPGKNSTVEQLGEQAFNGVFAKGVRTITVIPSGEVGNDRPISIGKDVWTVTDLQVIVREVYTDPRSGTTIHELQDLSREDPPITMFQPPPGYTVKTNEQLMKEMKDKMAAAAAKPAAAPAAPPED